MILDLLTQAVAEVGAGTYVLVGRTAGGAWTCQVFGGGWDAPVFVAAEVHPDREWAIRACAVSWVARTQVTAGSPTIARSALIQELCG